jgi:uncharacterized cupin superfamily protein
MTDRRHPHVINVDEAELMETAQGGFAFHRRRLAAEAGGGSLGCSHFELPAGKTAFPFHFHTNVEEALFILEGTGTLRIGEGSVALRPGDYVALPPGPDAPHALTNTGSTPLRYLALSSPAAPVSVDVVAYPDSKKVAYAAGVDPKKGLKSAWLWKLIKEDIPSLDYYQDEPLAKT